MCNPRRQAFRWSLIPCDLKQADHKEDVKLQEKHVASALRAFKALLKSLDSISEEAKAEFPSDTSKHGRYFIKFAKQNTHVNKFLDEYIGTNNDDPRAYSWRNNILTQLRDVLVYGKKQSEALEEVKKQAIKGFQAMELAKGQSPLRKVLPEDIMAFLPKNIVVEVDNSNEIQSINDRFANQRDTLKQKIDVQHELIKKYNAIARKVKRDLQGSDEVTKLSALITAIIMETGIRPGKDGNVTIKNVDGKKVEVETFGAVTLGPQHVKFVKGNFAELEFAGKKGTVNIAMIRDSAVLEILKEYRDKAVKGKSKAIFVTNDGYEYDVSDLQRYFRSNVLSNFSPTDFRKLRATEEVLFNLQESQKELRQKIRQFVNDEVDDLQEKVTQEVAQTINDAYSRAQKALSHEDLKTTVTNYVNPEVILYFLSKGKVEGKLEDVILSGKPVIRFDPQIFIDSV